MFMDDTIIKGLCERVVSLDSSTSRCQFKWTWRVQIELYRSHFMFASCTFSLARWFRALTVQSACQMKKQHQVGHTYEEKKSAPFVFK